MCGELPYLARRPSTTRGRISANELPSTAVWQGSPIRCRMKLLQSARLEIIR